MSRERSDSWNLLQSSGLPLLTQTLCLLFYLGPHWFPDSSDAALFTNPTPLLQDDIPTLHVLCEVNPKQLFCCPLSFCIPWMSALQAVYRHRPTYMYRAMSTHLKSSLEPNVTAFWWPQCSWSAEPLWSSSTTLSSSSLFYSVFFFILYTLYQCKPVLTASYQTKTVSCSTTQLGTRLTCYSHRNEEPLEIHKAIPHQAKKTKLSVVVSGEKRCHSELASLCRSCGLKAKKGLVVPLLGTHWTAFI